MEKIALQVYEQYQTYNPYILADRMGVLVAEDNLKCICAYYAHVDDIKIICLHAERTDTQKAFALTHCLYHAYMQKSDITVMQRRAGQLSNHEKDGNLFAEIFLNRKDE